MPIGEIAALPADLLAVLQEEAEDAAKAARSLADWLNGAIGLRYADRAAAARRAEGKDTGTVRLDDGEVTVIADLPKKVEWDQAALGGMVARIRAAGDDPAEYVETTFRVSERKYARLADGDPRGLRGGPDGEAGEADLPPRARGGALMALRIVTADERLAEANLKTTAVILGSERLRQDHPREIAAGRDHALSRPRGRAEVGAGLARRQPAACAPSPMPSTSPA